MSNSTETQNHRGAHRVAVGHRGLMLHGSGLTETLDCIIENRSDRGALLIFNADVGIPKRFIVFDRVDGQCNTAELVWRRGAAAGVAFLRTFNLNIAQRT